MNWLNAITSMFQEIWQGIFKGISLPFIFDFTIGDYLIILLMIRLLILLLKVIRGDSKE